MADAQDTQKPTEDHAAELDEEENEKSLETVQQVDSDSGSLEDSDEEEDKPKAVEEKPTIPDPLAGIIPPGPWRKMRRIIAEDPEWSLATIPRLSELVLRHFVDNFANNSKVLLDLLPKHRDAVLKKLPTTLPIHITAPLVEDEGYWERYSRARWEICDVSVYGGCWKRFFFERHVQHLIENFVPDSTDDTELMEALKLSCGLIRRLDIRQLLPPVKVESSITLDDESEDSYVEEDSHHMDLRMVVKLLPNLEELNVTYGVRDCGMNFEWKVFKFTSSDCLILSQTVAECKTLRVVRLRRSQMDDAKMRVFIRNLLDHPSLEELDLSTNIIGDHGARALCMLLKSRCKLVKLNLCDNQIKGTGALALAHALTRNTSLRYLNLRHNHVGDEGGQALCRGLAKNATLLELNLSSNDIGESTALLLSHVVTINSTLKSLDLSCNRLGLEGGKQLREGMEQNRSLTNMDLRLTDCGQEAEYRIHLILHQNREADRTALIKEREANAPPQRKETEPQFSHRFRISQDFIA